MEHENEKPTGWHKLSKPMQIAPMDVSNPSKPQEVITVDTFEDDEDENTIAKSLVDEIIEETEHERDADAMPVV